MPVEIERKWVAGAVPRERLRDDGQALRQGYLALDGDVSVRVRIVDEVDAVLTIKAGSGLARTEVEAPLPADAAAELWPHTARRRIVKRRYRVPLATATDPDAPVAEVDVYDEDLLGLCTVEVEFASTADAAAFTPPDWFGREVTGDGRWSNAALAQHGRPPP